MEKELRAQSEAFVNTSTLSAGMGIRGYNLVEFKAGITFLNARCIEKCTISNNKDNDDL